MTTCCGGSQEIWIDPACVSSLGGVGIARMTNFKLKDSWEFLLQSPLSGQDNGKVGSFRVCTPPPPTTRTSFMFNLNWAVSLSIFEMVPHSMEKYNVKHHLRRRSSDQYYFIYTQVIFLYFHSSFNHSEQMCNFFKENGSCILKAVL